MLEIKGFNKIYSTRVELQQFDYNRIPIWSCNIVKRNNLKSIWKMKNKRPQDFMSKVSEVAFSELK